MGSGAFIGIASGIPGTQCNIEQWNLEQQAKANEVRVRTSLFTAVEFRGSVKVGGEIRCVSRKVYQRKDIDFSYYDRSSGLTNLQRMQKGRPPIGVDGRPLQLHHVLQREAGPMVEIREMTHEEYHRVLHGLSCAGMSFRNNPDLNKQYNNFRIAYWKWRAERYLKGEVKYE